MNFSIFQWRSLKTRITLFTLAIFLIGIWSLAFYASRMLREDMERVLGDQQLSTVTLLADEVDHELRDRMIVLEKLAGRLTPAMLGNPAGLRAFIEQILALQQDAFNGVVAYRLDGSAIVEVPHSPEPLAVADLETAGAESVAAALREGRSTIGRPVMGKQRQAPLFAMTVPIRDPQGQVIGALSGVINLGMVNFLDRVTEGRYGRTGGYVLVAPQYRLIVTATDRRRVMAALPDPGIDPTIDRFIDGFEGPIVYVSTAGAEILTSSRRIPVAAWDMVAILPTAEAFAPIRAMQLRMLLATLLLTMLAAAASWWMLTRQLSPLLDTARTLAALTGGQQPAAALPIARQDEIGELIGGFNRLLETLGQREKALLESESFKNAILNSMATRIAVVNRDGVIQAVNKSWRRWSVDDGSDPGRPAPHTEVGASCLAFFAVGSGFASDTEALRARSGIEAVLDGRLPGFSVDYACPLAQETRWFTMAVMPLDQYTGHGAVITHSEITALKRAEQYEQYRSRTLELLAADEPLEVILDALVRDVERLNPAMLCSILLCDSEGTHLLSGAAPSLPDFFTAAVNGLKIGAGIGSCGTAAYTGQRVVVEDVTTHPYWKRSKSLAARAGLGSCWSEPIRASTGQVLGTFAIYHRQAHTPAESDIVIIEQAAHLASIAIEKNLSAERLRESEAHYRLLIENVSDIVWRQDRDHRFTYISPADERLRGYRADEVIGRSVTEVLPDEGVALLRETQRQRDEAEQNGIRTGITRFELPQLCKNGRLIWLEVLSTPERDAHGTITGYHGISRKITRRKHEDEQVRQLAFYDPLTALPNRRLLNDRLRQAMAASTRTGCHGAVMFVDLDNFKPLNDERGHVAGDLLLIETAARLKRCVREMDTVARYGGDEFVVIISELDVDETESMSRAHAIAEKIRIGLSQPYTLTIQREGQAATTLEHHCSASIGVVLFIDHQASQDEILKRADAAMYEAKQAGRNIIRFDDRNDCG